MAVRAGHRNARKIDTLVVGKNAAVLDDGVHGPVFDAVHSQSDESVVERDGVARRQIRSDRIVNHRYDFLVAFYVVRGERKPVTGRQLDRTVGKFPDAHLGSLHVREDRHRLSRFARRLANHLRRPRM